MAAIHPKKLRPFIAQAVKETLGPSAPDLSGLFNSASQTQRLACDWAEFPTVC